MNYKLFANRKILIVTKHQKEQVILPLLETFGLEFVLSSKFDTDLLGTFNGEISRKDDAINTLRKKCQIALEIEDFDLAIASEGSFGNHPTVFFAAADDELVMLLDKKNNLEIIGRELSLETNFDTTTVTTIAELETFASKAQFPSHAVIVRPSDEDFSYQKKGISNWEDLLYEFNYIVKEFGSCYIETDMRALYNPTRMKVIAKATENLVQKMKSCCPICETPGFSITEAVKGLRCTLCNLPTKSTLKHVLECQKCHYKEEQKFPNGKEKEDPMYCDYCNP
jgi:hypothetical protein